MLYPIASGRLDGRSLLTVIPEDDSPERRQSARAENSGAQRVGRGLDVGVRYGRGTTKCLPSAVKDDATVENSAATARLLRDHM